MKLGMVTIGLLLISILLAVSPSPNGCPICKNVEGEGDLAGIYYYHNENSECDNGCSYERDDGECCFCFAPGNYSVTKCDYDYPVNGLCYNNTAYPWIEQHITPLPNNDVYTCREYCMTNYPDNTYYGLQDSNLCLCGTLEQPTVQHLQVSQALCNIRCAGNSLQFCGGTEVANLYKIRPLEADICGPGPSCGPGPCSNSNEKCCYPPGGFFGQCYNKECRCPLNSTSGTNTTYQDEDLKVTISNNLDKLVEKILIGGEVVTNCGTKTFPATASIEVEVAIKGNHCLVKQVNAYYKKEPTSTPVYCTKQYKQSGDKYYILFSVNWINEEDGTCEVDFHV